MAGFLDGWLGGLAGWLGPTILTLSGIASSYLLNLHFKFDQNWMKIADFIAVRLVIIEFSQKSVETLKPCKISGKTDALKLQDQDFQITRPLT